MLNLAVDSVRSAVEMMGRELDGDSAAEKVCGLVAKTVNDMASKSVK